MCRINNHPIVEREERKNVTIYVDGKKLEAKEGK